MRILPIFLAMSCCVTAARATSAPPNVDNPPAQPGDLRDDVPLDAYLDALAQISPAARDGAAAYLDAFRLRCGRPLKTIELRRAIAEGDGDPVLMAMVRAASQRDTAALQRLSGTISCARRR